MAKRLGFPFNRFGKRTKVEESSPSPLSSQPPLPFPSVSISQPSAAASKLPEEGEAAGDAELMFMFFCYTTGPIAYSLYAVDAPSCSSKPESSSSCDHHQVRKPDDTPPTIYPILEFPWGEHPHGMCCVELESKLYFLGGKPHRDQQGPLSRDVYVLDAATAAACASSSRSNQKGPSEELLKKGTPMNTGKPFPYTFVAYGRIFVIDGRSFYSDYVDEELSWFEVFDPDTDQWLTMPDPPIYVRLIGHAVVDKKVFLVGMDDSVFCFNLDAGLWVTSSKYSKLSHSPFYSGAEFVQDTLYACHKRTIVAFDGLCSSEAHQGHHDDKPERLFYHKAFLGPEMKEALYDGKYYAPHSSPYLVPYGNRTFCHALASSLPDPNNPIYLEDSERFHIRLTVFQAIKGTYTKFVYGHKTTYFHANFLSSADYVARSRCGAQANYAYLQACFSVPL